MATTDTITLRIAPASISRQVITVATGDFGYTIPFVVNDADGDAQNISTYTVTVKLWAPATPATLVIEETCVQDVPASGTCHYVVATGDLDTAGTYLGELELTKAGEELSTEQFIVVVQTNASSYATLTEVKASLDITGTSEDDVLTDIICRVSAQIDDYCDRSFAPVTATRYFDGTTDELIVPDLISVTTLKVDLDGNGVYESTLAATDYVLYPYQGPPYWKIRLAENSNYSDFAKGIRKGVEIAGVWGYKAAIPESIKQACLEMACRTFKQSHAAFGTEVGTPDIGTGTVFQGMSSDVKRQLAKYVRHEIG